MSKETDREWIRQCLFEYVALNLDGMDAYFKECWKQARRAVSDVPGYKKWLDWCRVDGCICEMIGEFWFDSFKGKGDQFKEFMERIDFSGYIERFKEDFEVEVLWVNHRKGPYWLKDRLDIDVRML